MSSVRHKTATSITCNFNQCLLKATSAFYVVTFVSFSGGLSAFSAGFLLAIAQAGDSSIQTVMLVGSSALLVFTSLRSGLVQGFLVGFICILPLFTLEFLSDLVSEEFAAIGRSFFFGIQILSALFLSLLFATLAQIYLRSFSWLRSFNLLWIVILAVATQSSLFAFKYHGDQWLTASYLSVVFNYFIFGIGYFISAKSVAEKTGFVWIKTAMVLSRSLARINLRNKNLSELDFTSLKLENADFRDSMMIRTRWLKAKGLDFALLDNTYLVNRKVRQLVTTLDGKSKDYSGLNMEGVNLRDADLRDANFTGANLNQSDLRNADLSGATLKQTQLEYADLTGATLTGACIEDWGITGTTILENIRCDFVYMRVQSQAKRNPLRKPDDEYQIFAEGEFHDFIKPYIDTLDLYHSQNVDPRAISIALKNLAINHPEDELEFMAIERRGKDGFNLKFKTAPAANKSELSRAYFQDYARIRTELPASVQQQLAAQDGEIRALKGTIEQFLATGTHQSNIQADKIQIIQGELVMADDRGIHIKAGGDIGSVSGIVGGDVSGVVNLGDISGTVSNTIAQLPDEPATDRPSIKELLSELQAAIEAETQLPDEDKAEALTQVKVLAEAGQHPEDSVLQKAAKTAMKILRGTVAALPDAAKLAESTAKLLPAIAAMLALV